MARLPGKKIDTWEYSKDGREMAVPVRMVTSSRGSGQAFRVIIEELGIDRENKDINDLRAAVFADLDEKLTMTWEPYLHLDLSGGTELLKTEPPPIDEDGYDYDEDEGPITRRRHSMELRLSFDVQTWDLAQTPDGKKLSRETRGDRYSLHTWKGWPDTGKRLGDEESYYHRDRSTRALIPDTPANREALNQLSAELQRLLDRLNDLLAPDMVQQTLAGVIGGGFLLPPAPEGTADGN